MTRFRTRRPIFQPRGELRNNIRTTRISSQTKSIWHRVPTQHSPSRLIEIAIIHLLFSSSPSSPSPTLLTFKLTTPKRTHPSIGPSTPAVLHRRFSENLLRWVHQPAFFQRFNKAPSTVRTFDTSAMTGETQCAAPQYATSRAIFRVSRREIERPFGCCFLLLLLLRLPRVVGCLLLLRLFFLVLLPTLLSFLSVCLLLPRDAPMTTTTTTMNPSPLKKTPHFCAPRNKARSVLSLSLSLSSRAPPKTVVSLTYSFRNSQTG